MSEVLEVGFKRLHGDAIIPQQMRKGDAGLDISSVMETVIEPGKHTLVKTGLAIELPEGTEAQVRSRSGLALKNGVMVLNSPGTVDENYKGEIGVILANFGEEPFKVEKGMRVAQLVIKKTYTINIAEVKDLSESERGAEAYGSSGL